MKLKTPLKLSRGIGLPVLLVWGIALWVLSAGADAAVSISNLQAASGTVYTLGSFGIGEKVYVDRTYAFTEVPASFAGKPYIQTANDDKSATGSGFLGFDLAEEATVHVLFDARAIRLPAWLDDGSWVASGERVFSGDGERRVFTKAFPAGTVRLGGNADAPMQGAKSMYSVVIFAKSLTAEPAPVPTATGDSRLGNLSYSEAELFKPVAILDSPRGHGNVAMVNGYLMVIYSSDGGGDSSNGGIEFWDVSNPRQPVLAKRYDNADTHGLREPHGFGFSNGYGGTYLAAQAVEGIQFWDVTDPLAIRLVNYLDLPGITRGDYTGDWWVFWQAPYVYVAGTSSGLYVIDASDPAAPQLKTRLSAAELGGLNPATAFAVGNLLILAEAQSAAFATLDISDPAHPTLIQRYDGKKGYSHLFAAGKILTSGGSGDPARMYVHSVDADGSIAFVGSVGSGLGNGGYGSYQDGYFHSGFSSKYAKFDIANLTQVGTGSSALAERDEDFAQVLGNLVFAGNDHGGGSALIVHQTSPDTIGPDVHWIYPPPNASGLALTSRVGLSMSDNVDLASVGPSSFTVQPVGGGPLPGKYSVQMGLVNFFPDQPLLPGTTYEVRVAGITDLAGNSGASFVSRFSTVAGAGTASGELVANPVSASGAAYTVETFSAGQALYSDAAETILKGFPAGLEGLDYIRTASADSGRSDSEFLQFQLGEEATVYVLFDEANGHPSWLDGWERTEQTVSTSAGPLRVFSRVFPAGAVSLGGNAADGGGGRMYSVLVLAQSAGQAPGCVLGPLAPVEVGASAAFSASVSGSLPLHYSWMFADGSSASAADPDHVYSEPGRYNIVLGIENPFGSSSCAGVRIAYYPATSQAPVSSSSILASDGRVYNVNPDNDSVTALDADTLEKLWETPVGKHPVSLAKAPDGAIWAINQDDASISKIDPDSGVVFETLSLARASQPHGLVFAPDGSAAYVSLTATKQLLQLDPAGNSLGSLKVGSSPRGLALSGDGSRLLLSRFISPDYRGEVRVVDTDTFAVSTVLSLAHDPGPDSESSGRGLPNYLGSPVISPDGRLALVPSKKDNIRRGLFRDGQPLTFESRVRTIVSRIDLTHLREDLSARVDLNDRAMAQSVLFSPLGDVYFVATLGSNRVELYDRRSGALLAGLNTGRAPRGMALSEAGDRLYVHNYLSRSVSVFDVTGLIDGSDNSGVEVAEIATVATEKLAADVLRGKRIFYNASDPRMSRDGYLSCAGCHLDGDQDGRVWDFTQEGEGLRNTIALNGRAGLGHGKLHWTANFDEVQDFEKDIRHDFSGLGFLTDAEFAATEDPLGEAKSGLDPDLDALAAYVASLDRVPASPHRAADGALTARAESGKQLFDAFGCASCHAGGTFQDGLRHDVGTIDFSSGLGLGLPLAGEGFDTPTLKGLWNSGPYLHNGQATSLAQVLDNPLHTGVLAMTDRERNLLIAYLLEIDESESDAAPADDCGGLIQEGEVGMLSGAFELGTDAAASGGQFVQVANGYGDNWLGASRTDSAVEFCFQVPEAGTYFLRGWIRADSSADNSFYVQLDGLPGGGYVWLTGLNSSYKPYYLNDKSGSPVAFPLAAGRHMVRVALRKDGTRLDKLELQRQP